MQHSSRGSSSSKTSQSKVCSMRSKRSRRGDKPSWEVAAVRLLASTAEVLEPREMLASNITASLSKGILTVTGSSEADRITLQPGVQAGTIQISVEGGTVNNAAGPITLSGLTKHFQVNLGSGDDVLIVQGFNSSKPLPKNFVVDAGAGADLVEISNIRVNGATSILLGTGSDTLKVDDSQFAKKVTLNAGDGNDGILVDRRHGFSSTTSFLHKTNVQLGAGTDVLRVGVDGDATRKASFAKPVVLNGGTETDTLALATGITMKSKVTFIENTTTATLPQVTVGLSNDTAPNGATNTDRITSDAAMSGQVVNFAAGNQLRGGFDQMTAAQFVDLSAFVQPDGSFALPHSNLVSLFPGALTNGAHTFKVQVTDNFGESSNLVSLTFTLDTFGPSINGFGLAQESNTGTIDDLVTSAGSVRLTGVASPNAVVKLTQTGQSVTADNLGIFSFNAIALVLGDNVFQVTTNDVAGNVGPASSITITRIEEVTEPSLVQIWNMTALNAIKDDSTPPPVASRGLAMLQVAVLDAIAPLLNEPGFMVSLTPPADADPDAAVIGAAFRMLSYLFPAQQSKFIAQRINNLNALPDTPAREAGDAFGQQVANAIIALRDVDGWDDFETYDSPYIPGVWVPTYPAYAEPLLPQWADLSPFAMSSSDEFLPPSPPSLTSNAYLEAYEEVRLYGAQTGSLRTADMTAIARFWADGGGTYTPPGHWNQVANEIAATRGLSLYENARLFAALNVAMADAGIASWNSKYTYDYWRPITAIQNAGADGNPNTTADPNWQPFLISPNFPEYLSGHSTFSGAAAEVLTALLGDSVSFTSGSVGFLNAQGQPVQRSFDNFWEAAEEAAQSRIYGGIHFSFSSSIGLDVGRQIGELVTGLFTVTTDITPPRVVVEQPESGQTVSSNFTVTGKAFDNLSGVDTVEYALDNGAFQPITLSADGSFSFPTTFPLTGSADGAHVLRFRATDNAGLVSATTDLTFTLDTLLPTLTILNPHNDQSLVEGDLLQGSVSGTGSSIVLLTYQFDNQRAVSLNFSKVTGQFSQKLDLSNLSPGSHVLKVTAQDAAGNQTVRTFNVTQDQQVRFGIYSVTPVDGSDEIGTTYRPQVYFTRAVETSTLNANNFYATNSAGQKIPATIVPAMDGSFAWLFFDSPLPGGATVTVHVKGNTILSAGDQTPLDADGDGLAGGNYDYDFTTVSLTPLQGTSLSGKLVDPGTDLKPMTFDDMGAGPDGAPFTADDVFKLPIAHVKVYIIGLEHQAVYTDAQGNFSFSAVPAGNVKLVLDGRTATNAPNGIYFPEMVMDLEMVVGAQNTVMSTMGTPEQRASHIGRKEVYLPRIQTSILQSVSDTETTMLGVSPEASPGLSEQQRQSLTLEVQPQSVIGHDGQPLPDAQVGLSTVPPELVRDMLPPGVLQHTFDITIQAPDAATFAVPLTLTFPNIFNAAPGTKLNFLSFDHTTGRLVIEGTATVSADGLTVVTDPGSGITKPGWHGLTPPGSNGDGDGPKPPPPPPPECKEKPGDGWKKGIELALAVGKLAVEFVPILKGAKCIFSVVESTANLIFDLQSFQSRGSGACVALGLLRTEMNRITSILDGCIPVAGVLGKVDNIITALDGILGLAGAGAAIAECGPSETAGWLKTAQDLLSAAKELASRLKNIDPGRQLNTVATQLIKKLDDVYCQPASGPVGSSIDCGCGIPSPGVTVGPDGEQILDAETLAMMEDMIEQLQNFSEAGSIFTEEDFAQYEAELGLATDANNSAYKYYLDNGDYSSVGTGTTSTMPYYYAVTNLDNSAAPVIRGRVNPNGRLEGVFLSPETRYELAYVDPQTLQVAYATFVSGISGSNTTFPTAIFEEVFQYDADGDGELEPLDGDNDLLPDEVERIIGTNATQFSTAGDGIGDGAKVQSGQNPLGAFIAQTGVVGAVQLSGSAQDVEVQSASALNPSLTAYVATGEGGLSIVNLGRPQTPVVLGEIDLPGFATDVAVDPQLSIAAVATGATGLSLVSVANATSPNVLLQIPGNISAVEIKDGIAYVGNGNNLQSYDILSGEMLSSLNVGMSVVDLALDGDVLYGLGAGSSMSSFAINNGEITLLGTLTLPQTGTSLFVGGGVAYIGADNGFNGGYMTAATSDPSDLQLLSGVDNGSLAGTDLAANGTGLVITVGNPGGVFGVNVTDIADGTDPENTGEFLTRFTMPSKPFGIALGGGLAFVANGTSGLQVVNYLAFDTAGVAPTITFDPSSLDRDLGTAGIQVQEGTRIDLNATFTDDVQLRSVEVLIDGVVVLRDVSFPFDLSAIAPAISETKTTATLKIRATDTGGNSRETAEVQLLLTPDHFAPVLVNSNPADGANRKTVPYLSLRFDESLDTNLLSSSSMHLLHLGADGVVGGDDDTEIPFTSITTRGNDQVLVLTFAGELVPGNYQLTVDATALGDRAGNILADDVVLHFTKRPQVIPISLNTVVEDAFVDPSDIQVFTFQGTAGQLIRLDVIEFDTNAAYYTITTPFGATLVYSYNGDTPPLRLTETGEYRIQFYSYGSTPEFSFRVLDTAAATPIVAGAVTEGTLSDGRMQTLYRFHGTAGQRYYLLGTTSTDVGYYAGGWSLTFEEYAVANNYGYLSYFSMWGELPYTGEYILTVFGTDVPPADFSFTLYFPETTTVPLTIGQVVTGDFSVPGEIDRFTFTATAGQQLYVDSLAGELYSRNFRLRSPSGALVFDYSTDYAASDYGPFHVTETGTYTLEIDAYYYYSSIPERGPYSLRMLDVSTTETLTFDTPVTGTLAAGATKIYQFSGSAGQRLYFDGQTDSNLTHYISGRWRLRNPQGELVFDHYGHLAYYDAEVVLGSNGQYLLEIINEIDFPRDFAFNVVTPQSSSQVISIGAEIVGDITNPGDVREYTFTGLAGQNLYWDTTYWDSNITNVTITSPQGTVVLHHPHGFEDHPFRLAEAGTYTIRVDAYDFNTPHFAFRVLDMDAGSLLPFDTEVIGTIDIPHGSQFFTFTATAGQRYYFEGRNDTDDNGAWFVYDSLLTRVAGNYGYGTYYHFEYTAQTAGTYYVLLYGYSDLAMDYDFVVQTPEDLSTPISLDTIVTGEITVAGQTNSYQFSGSAGQRIVLDGLSGDMNQYVFWLVDPDGVQVFYESYTLDHNPVTLTKTGSYTLFFDAYNSETPSYSFRVVDLGNATPLTFDAVITDTLDQPLGSRWYRFSTLSAVNLYLDGLTDTDLTPYDAGAWALFGPGNNMLFGYYGHIAYYDYEATLAQPGEYFLAIYGNGGVGPFDYSFAAYRPEISTTSMALETVVSGTISEPGEVDLFTFVGGAGQQLYLDQIGGDIQQFGVRLISPTGQVVLNRYAGADPHLPPMTLIHTGIYTVEIDATEAHTLPYYSFKLLDLANSEDLPLWTEVTGDVQSQQVKVFRVDAEAGQALDFEGLVDTGVVDYDAGGWALYDSAGHTLFDHYGYLTFYSAFATLDAGGTYYLVIRNMSDMTESYHFQTVDQGITPPAVHDTTPLVFDTLIEGDIGTAGEVDYYTFTATAGQRLHFETRDIDYDRLNHRLRAPSGTIVYERYNWWEGINVGPFTLSETGTYVLEIFGDGDETPNYAFTLEDMLLTPALVEGVTTGTLDYAHEVAWYRISASAGTRLYFDGQTDSNVVEYDAGGWVLLGPNNEVVFDHYGHIAHIDAEVTLPVMGDYLLAVYQQQPGTRTFQFAVNVINDTTQPLPLNSVVHGAIAQAGESNRYTFTAIAGDIVAFNALAEAGGYVPATLYAPDGSVAYSTGSLHDFGPLTLPQSGEYTLALSANFAEIPSYSFRMNRLSDATPVPFNTTMIGELDPGETVRWFQFQATAGDRIYFDGTSLTDNYYAGGWALVSPTLGTVFNNYGYVTQYDSEHVLSQAGTYWLALYGDGAGPNPYSFRLVPSETQTVPLTLGTLVSGEITKVGERDHYTFHGSAGQMIFFAGGLGGLDMNALDYRLIGPNGLVFDVYDNPDHGPVRLPADGTYTLELDGAADATPEYEFRLLDLASFPLISLDTTVNGVIDEASEFDFYRFVGTAGQRIYFDALSATANYHDGGWGLLSPTLQTVFDNYGYLAYYDAEVVLPQNGEYIIFINSDGPAGDTYAFRTNTITNLESALTIGQTVTGSIANPGDRRTFTFEGTAGQVLYFDDLQDGTDDYHWNLLAPNGMNLNAQFAHGQYYGPYEGVIRLNQTGTYRLEYDPPSADTPEFSFRILEVSQMTPAAFGTVHNGTLDDFETRFFTFTATAGQRLYFDGQNTTGEGYYAGGWRLISPTLETLWDHYGYGTFTDREITLSQAGTYVLAVYGGSSGSHNYNFEIVDAVTTTAPLTLETEVAGSLDHIAQKDVYTFNGTPGQTVILDLLEIDSLPTRLQIYSPTNDLVFHNNSWWNQDQAAEPLVLKEYGNYRVVVSSESTEVQDYSFVLRSSASLPQLPLNEVISGVIPADNSLVGYTFTGSAGQFLSLTSSTTGWWYDGEWVLWTPVGNQLSVLDIGSDSLEIILPGTGTYSLLLNIYDEFLAGEEFTLTTSSPQVGLTLAESSLTTTGEFLTAGDFRIDQLLVAAKLSWLAQDLTTSQQLLLQAVSVRIGDLNHGLIGVSQGTNVVVDVNGGGQGWFIDPTPDADEEFGIPLSNGDLFASTEASRSGVDLLTVLRHELGHILGYDHTPAGLMSQELSAGVRRDLDAVFATGIDLEEDCGCGN